MNRLCLISLALLQTLSVSAQQPCPSVSVDSSGVAVIKCRDAGYDRLCIEGSVAEKRVAMTSLDSMWVYISSALPSEMYTYRFIDDDGDSIIPDPCNHNVVRDVDEKYNFFIVDGWPGTYYRDRNVPHGAVEKVWYPSSFNEQMPERRMCVYLPPGYSDGTDSYPVLYLLHGTGGDETAWCGMGRLAQIMDNMLAEGRFSPMIVVMPNGIANQDAAPGESRYMDSEAHHMNVESWMGRTEAAFTKEVLAFVENHYRVIPDKAHRAIAGLSMGAMHAAVIAANAPDTFDYVGMFSPQTVSALSDSNIKLIKGTTNFIGSIIEKIPASDKLIKKFANRRAAVSDMDVYSNIDDKILRLFHSDTKLNYIAIGKDDPLKRYLKSWTDFLDENDCPYYYNETEGGHSWENWRLYLMDFVSRIF